MCSTIDRGSRDIVIVVVMACTNIVVVLSQMIALLFSLVRIEGHGCCHLNVLFFLRHGAAHVAKVFITITVVAVTAIFAIFAFLAWYIYSDVGFDTEVDK